jgi:hypothetical protein
VRWFRRSSVSVRKSTVFSLMRGRRLWSRRRHSFPASVSVLGWSYGAMIVLWATTFAGGYTTNQDARSSPEDARELCGHDGETAGLGEVGRGRNASSESHLRTVRSGRGQI